MLYKAGILSGVSGGGLKSDRDPTTSINGTITKTPTGDSPKPIYKTTKSSLPNTWASPLHGRYMPAERQHERLDSIIYTSILASWRSLWVSRPSLLSPVSCLLSPSLSYSPPVLPFPNLHYLWCRLYIWGLPTTPPLLHQPTDTVEVLIPLPPLLLSSFIIFYSFWILTYFVRKVHLPPPLNSPSILKCGFNIQQGVDSPSCNFCCPYSPPPIIWNCSLYLKVFTTLPSPLPSPPLPSPPLPSPPFPSLPLPSPPFPS